MRAQFWTIGILLSVLFLEFLALENSAKCQVMEIQYGRHDGGFPPFRNDSAIFASYPRKGLHAATEEGEDQDGKGPVVGEVAIPNSSVLFILW